MSFKLLKLISLNLFKIYFLRKTYASILTNLNAENKDCSDKEINSWKTKYEEACSQLNEFKFDFEEHKKL